MSNRKASFEVRVAKDTFKFNAAHFVAFQGFRERLHGHTYTASVRLIGSNKICSDGYVLDYGDVKKVTAKVCKELNEHFLCPMLSDVLRISIEKDPTKETQQGSVTIICEDRARFVFPESDCILLPIVHATSEELDMYLWQRILQRLDVNVLRKRGIETLEITVAEAPGQDAVFLKDIPDAISESQPILDVRDFIDGASLEPSACSSAAIKRYRRPSAI
jgi:6-pyruvoyl-tetrahydropterin synthase